MSGVEWRSHLLLLYRQYLEKYDTLLIYIQCAFLCLLHSYFGLLQIPLQCSQIFTRYDQRSFNVSV